MDTTPKARRRKSRSDLVHLRSLPSTQPATKIRQVTWTWAEIKAGLAAGMKLKEVWEAAGRDGLVACRNKFVSVRETASFGRGSVSNAYYRAATRGSVLMFRLRQATRDVVRPIPRLRFGAKAKASETFPISAGTTEAADERRERVNGSVTLRSVQESARAAAESEAVQIRVRSVFD
jgi:hypothetical protein